MKTNTEKRDNVIAQMRPAYSMLELIFALIIIGGFLYGLYSAFGKTDSNAQAQVAQQQASSVIAGLESAKRLNGGTYLVASNKKLNTLTKIANSLGGANNMKDVQDWTYTCASGAGQTITLTTNNYETIVIRDLLIDSINSNNRPWVAAASGNKITIKKSNVTCR